MTIHKLISKLEDLKAIHGEGCRVLVGNEMIYGIEYVSAVGECSDFVNISD